VTEEEKQKIFSEDYADLLIEYEVDEQRLAEFTGDTINYMDDTYAVIHFPVSRVTNRLRFESGYAVIPNLYGLLDTSNLEEMGVKRIQSTPALALRGQGVLLGFIDTGIDYTDSVFLNADNTTRIVAIWDQSIENLQATEETFNYGTQYFAEQINLALQSPDPLSVVPSTDDIGHGTTLAGLTGGSAVENVDFVGVVPEAEYVIVKLKPAKQYLKNFFFIPEGAVCYQENDIMFALYYLFHTARRLNRPIVICIGLGTNMGGHDGRSPLELLLSNIGERNGIAIVIAAGNEGNAGHHFFGIVDRSTGFETVELRVGEGENGFSMEIWGQVPGTYSIDMISPTGEYIPRIPARLGESREIRFLFERTTVYVDYLIIESQTGDQLIFIRFNEPAPGIWRFRVYGGGDITTGFHIWLPLTGFITENTAFIRPNPDTTVTSPGNSLIPITVTAYNHKNQSIYRNASRGYTRDNIIKPELTAPGVEVYGPDVGNTFSNHTGTSISAAEAAGVSAMLMEWGIVRGNFVFLDSIAIKKFLIRGVKRSDNTTYPNREWGFGIIDIYRTFVSLRGES